MSRSPDDNSVSTPSARDNETEIRLLHRVVRGDVPAFSLLVAQYYTPLVRFAMRLTGSRDAAEDVLQEVWLRLWRVRETLDPNEPIRAYLHTAVRRACANARRARTREDFALGRLSFGTPSGQTDASTDTLGELVNDEMTNAIRGAVESLPARCREVWLLAREQGLSYAEIAIVLGISVNTVKTQMTRAMTVLRTVAAGYLTVLIAVRIGS